MGTTFFVSIRDFLYVKGPYRNAQARAVPQFFAAWDTYARFSFDGGWCEVTGSVEGILGHMAWCRASEAEMHSSYFQDTSSSYCHHHFSYCHDFGQT